MNLNESDNRKEYNSFGMHDAAIATGMTAKEWSNWFPPYRMAIKQLERQ